MSDTSKKRSRKSKLVPRDCGEDEGNKKARLENRQLSRTLLSELITEDRQLDSLPNPLQTVLPKLRTQLDKTNDHDISTREINFSVDIEVEECGNDDDNFCIEIANQKEWPIFVPDKQYRSALNKLSKITRALADKILEVHINNYLGHYVNEEPFKVDYLKKTIEEGLTGVLAWQKKSRFRDTILSYKCYICDIGWWHLGPFEEHIRDHGEDLRISVEATSYEASMVAHFESLNGIKEIPIEGRCWRCMKTWDEHVNLKRLHRFYSCISCNFKSPTCLPLFEHEGICVRYHKEHINEMVNYETTVSCSICKINCVTENRLKAHLILTHFARSDVFTAPVNVRTCPFCNFSYVYHVLHTCRNRSLSVVCNYCMKWFPTKILADIHMTNTRKNIRCRLCNAYMRSECMEAEHMIKHSKNYVLLYKCMVCPDHTLINTDETLLKEHKKKHPEKRCSKGVLFQMIVAPRKLFPDLPFNEDEMMAPVKPHILGPLLAPLPKKSNVDKTTTETQSAVDAIRYDRHDVHGHDYLLHDTMTEIQYNTTTSKETQQQVVDEALAAVQSISDDATVKTEIEEYEYYDHTEMDIVYEDIDIKKEEFLDTLSNAYVSAEDVTDSIDDQDISNVFKMSKQLVTVIKEEKRIHELMNDNTEEIEIKKESLSDEDDFEDDIIVLNNGNATEKVNYAVPVDDNKDTNDDEYLTNNLNNVVPVDNNKDTICNENQTNDVNDVVPVIDNKNTNDVVPIDDNKVTNDNENQSSDLNETVPVHENKVTNDNEDQTNDLNDIVPVDDNRDTNDENKTIDLSDDDDDTNNVNDDDDNRDTNNENKTIDLSDDNDDTNNVNDDDDDVTIINKGNETIDISDTEMQVPDNADDDSNKSSEQSHETLTSETNKENDEEKVIVKERAKNKIYECKKCDFKGVHKEFRKHMRTYKSHHYKRVKLEKVEKVQKFDGDLWSSYPCTTCERTFSNFQRYMQHLKVHKIPANRCPECLEIFNQHSQLRNHVNGHIRKLFTNIHIILENDTYITSKQDKVYQCKKCVQVIKYKKFFKHWESHLKLETKQPVKVECKVESRQVKVCEVKVERNEEPEDGELAEEELSADMLKEVLKLLRAPSPRVPRDDPTHKCSICGRPFARGPYLKRHYVEHLLRDALCKRARAGTETMACQICAEGYSNNLQYKHHMRNHANLPVYHCELCARSFSDSSNFAKHKKVHNMAVTACDLCGAKFVKRESYIKHIRMHQQTNPIKCKDCPRIFHSASHYRRHQRSAHAGPSGFPCPVCLTKLPSTKEKLDHMWTVHRIRQKKVDCPVCNRSFRKFIDMKYHLKIKHNAGLTLNSKHFFSASEADRTFSWVHLNTKGRTGKKIDPKREENGVPLNIKDRTGKTDPKPEEEVELEEKEVKD